MHYLLYFLDGFARKFPIEHERFRIGRDEDNEISVDDEFMSRHHVEILKQGEEVVIRDLNSSNGTYIENDAISERSIKCGESFCAGRYEFYLRRGDLEEFETSGALNSVFSGLRHEREQKIKTGKTKAVEDLYLETLKEVLRLGLASRNFETFLPSLAEILRGVWKQVTFSIVSQIEDENRVHMIVEGEPGSLTQIDHILGQHSCIFERETFQLSTPDDRIAFRSWLLHTPTIRYVFAILTPQHKNLDKVVEFSSVLISELKLLSSLFKDSSPSGSTKPGMRPTGDRVLATHIKAGNTKMKQLIRQAKKFAKTDIFVLIQGESGTGKELFARLIHQHSNRNSGPFVALNCAAIPENLLESELFGFEKGAFTGADRLQKGKLELSSGGTLVLDEIGNMPLDLQMKLLRAIQEQEFYRIGGAIQIKVDLRIISLTNEDLKSMLEEGTFRKDLYYRLVHRAMMIPPLRERPEDIPILINYFTHKACVGTGKRMQGYSMKAYHAMLKHPWDGNVRELENEVNVLVNLVDDLGTIQYDMLSESIKDTHAHEGVYQDRLMKVDPETEKEALKNLLEKHKWNKSQAARSIGMTYRGLHEKLKRLGVKRPNSHTK